MPLLVAGMGVAAGVMAIVVWGWAAGREQPGDGGMPIPTPRLATRHQGYSRTPVFSPDGKWMAFSTDQMGKSYIQVQRAEGGEARALTGGEVRDYEPAWSSDGKKLAFLREKRRGRYGVMVREAFAETGQEREIGDVAIRGTLEWKAGPGGGSILAADRVESGRGATAIVEVGVSDGSRRQVTTPPQGYRGDSMPRLRADGERLAFVRSVEEAVQDVHTVDLREGAWSAAAVRRTQEDRTVNGLTWLNETELVVSLQRGSEMRSLWRVSLAEGTVAAPPRRIPEAGLGPVEPHHTKKGDRLAYVSRIADTNIWRIGRNGEQKRALTGSIQLDTSPRISPDGKHVAWRSLSSGMEEVWIAAADGSGARQLTRMNGPTSGSPGWSPDGKQLVIDSRPKGNGDVFIIPREGGALRALTRESSNEVVPSFSHDGKWVYFSTDRSGGVWEVWRVLVERPEGTAQRVVGGGAFRPRASSDGKWIYYARQGVAGIWRIPAEGGGPEEQIATEPAARFWGQWAISRKALFFAVFPGTGKGAIRRMDLTSRAVSEVTTLDRLPVQFDSGMSVAPDESWLAWTQLDQAGSDIYVIDGFR